MDNQSAIRLVKNPKMHKRTKLTFKIDYVPSEQQLADILTKPLPRKRFCDLRDLISVIELK